LPRRGPCALVVDCFDSFTFNVVGLLRDVGAFVEVVRVDADPSRAAVSTRPDLLVLSPGPGRPRDYPTVDTLIERRLGRTPILGICLGMQALVAAAGGRIARAPRPLHGKTSRVRHDGGPEFDGVPRTFRAMRYHSLGVVETSLPPELDVAARAEDGVIMAVRHRHVPAFGLQFHPESFRTEHGGRILANILGGALER
jgi:anthranilate synthase/aminodeoxychorismate synthase-like glutamine amidotransferase